MYDAFEAEDPHNGETPLHFAARSGNYKALDILLECHVNPNPVNSSGKTALHYVAKRGFEKECEVL